MSKQNRTYKDSVFGDLFYSDRDARKLYNALFGADLHDPDAIELVRLEEVLFKNLKNDVAFTVQNRKIILSEHQSTVNPNMPLRMLMYIAREYESIIPADARYSSQLVKVPSPSFFVFYNGVEDQPAEQVLKLSAAFFKTENEETKDKRNGSESFAERHVERKYNSADGTGLSLELIVRVININIDKHHIILEKCSTLRQYSAFVEKTRGFRGDPDALEKAVKSCIRENILADYLRRKGKEVVNMLMTEYDYAMDMEVQCREARAEGCKEGQIIVYFGEMHLSIPEIAEKIGISEAEVEKILREKKLL